MIGVNFLSHDQYLLFGANRKPVDILSLNSIFKLFVLLAGRTVKLIYIYIEREREGERERERERK